MAMDTKGGRLFGLTWPSGRFLVYDIAKKELRDLGLTSELGEKGVGPKFRVVCRSIAVPPASGAAYFTTSTGDIWCFQGRRKEKELEKLPACTMKRDIFGTLDPDKPGHMGTTGGRLSGTSRRRCSTASTETRATCSGSMPVGNRSM